MPTSAPHIDWDSAAATHTGKVRKHNEDALSAYPEQRVWGVADGMGGHHAGDVASGTVAKALSTVTAHRNISAMIDDARTHLGDANHELFTQGLQAGAKLSGATVVVLLASGGQGAVLWAGDSRAYRMRDGQFKQLTRDHSRINDLIDSGQLEPEVAEQHPEANVITRAVGVSGELELDIVLLDILPGDRYLLCSDGLSRYVDEATLARLLTNGSASEVVAQMLQTALDSPARDNISVVIAQAIHAEPDHTALNPVQARSQDEDDDPTVLDLDD